MFKFSRGGELRCGGEKESFPYFTSVRFTRDLPADLHPQGEKGKVPGPITHEIGFDLGLDIQQKVIPERKGQTAAKLEVGTVLPEEAWPPTGTLGSSSKRLFESFVNSTPPPAKR